MISRQRRVDEIADNLPIRTTRMYPQAAQSLYRQDLAFNHTAGCRQYDGRSTAQEHLAHDKRSQRSYTLRLSCLWRSLPTWPVPI